MITTKRIIVQNDKDNREEIFVFNEEGKQVDTCTIQVDKNGREYYCPTNPNDDLGLFTDKIKDAIDCIKAGYGDCIMQTGLFGMKFTEVVRYIDRVYGENVRNETIKGWMDAEFTFGVKFTFLNSMSGGNYVCKDESLYGFDNKAEDIMAFETESDAEKYITKVNETASSWHQEYDSIKEAYSQDKNKEKEAIDHFFAKHNLSLDSVYWSAFRGVGNKKKLDYKMSVVQILKV